jgi:hypothetical protein
MTEDRGAFKTIPAHLPPVSGFVKFHQAVAGKPRTPKNAPFERAKAHTRPIFNKR